MATIVFSQQDEARHHGLRMTSEDYFRLEDDGFRYELIDGVVCMSPSPTPVHQAIVAQLAVEIGSHLRQHQVGRVFVEVDVYLGVGPGGQDLVYRPDVVFLASARAAKCRERIVGPPDLVVEVISGHSRHYDSETKKGDYERCGVLEYWLIDPKRETMTFYCLESGRFVEITPSGDQFPSQAVPGFVLDLQRVRDSFEI